MARTGKKRERLLIQQAVEQRTASGGVDKTWQLYAAIWAERQTIRGREFWENYALHGETSVRFLCRWYPNVTTQMRIVGELDDRIFNIIEVNEDRRIQFGDMMLTTIQTDEIMAQGDLRVTAEGAVRITSDGTPRVTEFEDGRA